jgi:hypothetical protein
MLVQVRRRARSILSMLFRCWTCTHRVMRPRAVDARALARACRRGDKGIADVHARERVYDGDGRKLRSPEGLSTSQGQFVVRGKLAPSRRWLPSPELFGVDTLLERTTFDVT